MSSTGFHEDAAKLSGATQDMHRAIVSLMEELEAVDWYQQRVDAASDEELKAILAHNRDEEIEHAAMVLEWLRRRNAKFDEQLGTYLNTTGSILEVEDNAMAAEAGEGAPAKAESADGSLRIGSLKGSN
ncbi:ferritin [Allostella vacuolata]|nr:ferritin [Stella vacuolata]